MNARRPALVVVFSLLALKSFANDPVPESFWSSPLWIRDGVSDFDGNSVAAFFRNVKFQEVVLPEGDVIDFSIASKSVTGSEIVMELSMLRNKVVAEQFDFYFHYKPEGSLLYKFSSIKGTVEGYDEMRRVMSGFYLPTLSEDTTQ